MRKRTIVLSLLIGISLVAAWVIFVQISLITTVMVKMPDPPSPKPLPPTSLGVVDEVVSRLEWGNIAFDTPMKMKFEEPKIVELLLSPTKSAQELQSSLKSHEQTEAARIQISNRMEADLSGLGFKIEALGNLWATGG